MTLEEAKSLMTAEALEKLKEVTSEEPDVKISPKINNDILMTALCNGVANEVIKRSSLDLRTLKLLNSNTNSLQEHKFYNIINTLRLSQPTLRCRILLMKKDVSETLNCWTYDGSDKDVPFIEVFNTIIKQFNITPTSVRRKLSSVLKLSIVNNIAQLVAKYVNSDDADRAEIKVSINTITRLVNMEEHLIFAEFIN